MNKQAIVIITTTLVILSALLFITTVFNRNQDFQGTGDQENAGKGLVADKIEVVHFHGTQQCWSCITVGEYALKTIQEKFPKEYKNGTITFEDVNGELKENNDIVMKYQARGSSLFINAISNGKDNIQENVTVWRLVGNEDQFMNYFENELNELLGQ